MSPDFNFVDCRHQDYIFESGMFFQIGAVTQQVQLNVATQKYRLNARTLGSKSFSLPLSKYGLPAFNRVYNSNIFQILLIMNWYSLLPWSAFLKRLSNRKHLGSSVASYRLENPSFIWLESSFIKINTKYNFSHFSTILKLLIFPQTHLVWRQQEKRFPVEKIKGAEKCIDMNSCD